MSDQKSYEGIVTLGDLINTQKGFAFKSAWFSKEGRKIVKVSNFSANSIDLSSLAHIPEELAKRYERYGLTTGDILIQTVGSWPSNPASVVGKVVKVPSGAEGALLNQNAVKLTPLPSISNSYLYYALKSSTFLNYIVGTAQGAASQASVTLDSIKSYRLSLPSFATQQRIASILSTYDDLIENNTRRIEILEEMARRLYEEWFVHFRFPEHEEVSFKECEIGKIPDGWEVASLESFGRILTGKTPSKKKPELFGSEVPFIKLPDMHDQIFITETNEALSKVGEDTQRKKTVPANSICVSCIGTGGIVVITSKPSQTNQQINTVVPARSELREFLYFSALALQDDINNYGATGATMTNLSRGKFASLKVIAPCEELVSSYSKLTAPMFDRILNLQRANRNLRDQRDLLLPKLISGEIDMSDISMFEDKEVEAA